LLLLLLLLLLLALPLLCLHGLISILGCGCRAGSKGIPQLAEQPTQRLCDCAATLTDMHHVW
jgi:hypothetical protein